MREALKVKADCGCSQVADQRDGDWVKVGGMITESKKIRTRAGSQMMFATLDDLEGSVEIVVFEKALAAVEGLLAADEIVIVRGRVDHKDAAKVCVIVQDVERFDPSDAEIERAKEKVAAIAATSEPEPLRLPGGRRATAGGGDRGPARPARALPGRRPSSCSRWTRAPGVRCLRFGEGYKVAGRNAALKAELGPRARPGARGGRARSGVTAARPRVAVVGPGAIGATIAAAAQRGGADLVLCGRTPSTGWSSSRTTARPRSSKGRC